MADLVVSDLKPFPKVPQVAGAPMHHGCVPTLACLCTRPLMHPTASILSAQQKHT